MFNSWRESVDLSSKVALVDFPSKEFANLLTSLVEKLSLCQFRVNLDASFQTLCHIGRIIPNIHITLDHFPITLDISYHFG